MSTLTLKVGIKGSAKSGNYGHAGRPGKVGGSAPKSTGSLAALTYNQERSELAQELRNELEFMRSGGFYGHDLLANVESIELFGSFVSAKRSPTDIDVMLHVPSYAPGQEGWNTTQVFKQNQHIFPKHNNNCEILIVSHSDPDRHWKGGATVREETKKRYGADTVTMKLDDFMTATKELTIRYSVKGSAKSGNYGHAGRIGKVGGSAPKAGIAQPRYSKLEDMPSYKKHGNDISPELIGDYYSGNYEDKYLSEMMQDQGFDGKPEVLSKEEMDSHVAAGETEIWRGLNDRQRYEHPGQADQIVADYAEQYRSGKVFAGLGMYGNGVYAGKTGSAMDFASEDGVIMRMTIKKDAKVVEAQQILGEIQDDFGAGKGLTAANVDNGHWATVHGYDVIHVPLDMVSGTDEQWVILNRTAVRVESHNYTYNEVGQLWQAGKKAMIIQYRVS